MKNMRVMIVHQVIYYLASFSQIRKLTKSMNFVIKINGCPNNICGVQQSIQEHILHHFTYFNKDEGINTPDTSY